MPVISIYKTSRKVQFEEGVTKEQLVDIIRKWAPKIANDEDKSPYEITGIIPVTGENYESIGDLLDSISP